MEFYYWDFFKEWKPIATPHNVKICFLSLASQKKKKRKNTWKNGFIRRKKTSSHLNSKDNPNTGESGDEEEDEDEEEDGKQAETEDAENMKDTECELMEVDGCARAEGPAESTSNAGVENNLNTNEETLDECATSTVYMNGEALQNGDVHPAESTRTKRTELTSEDNTGTG